jgi:hypothetical protein
MMRILRVAFLTFATALWSWPSRSRPGHLKPNGSMQCAKAGT